MKFLKSSYRKKFTKSFKYLLLGSALLGFSTFSKPAKADAPPKCTDANALGAKDSSGRFQRSANDVKGSLNFCTDTPERFEITIYELGLCKEEPFKSTSKFFNRETGECTITMTSAGSVADIANTTISLPQMSGRPPSGDYQYAYIIIKNEFGLRGSITMDSGSGSTPKTFFQYCPDDQGVSTGQTSSCTAQNHDEELDDFGDSDEDPENQEIGFSDFFPTSGSYEDMGNNEGVSALLVKDDLSQAVDRLATRKLIGLFKSSPTNKVTITDSTNGLEMQLTVTDIGYGIEFNSDGEPSDFGSQPFKPIFKTF